MFKQLSSIALSLSLLMAGQQASAAISPSDHFKLTILTENYPPLNMSISDKNFAQGDDDDIDGVSTDIVREMMSRAKVDYSLTLRFPWSKVYRLGLKNRDVGVYTMARLPEREDKFKWVRPLNQNRYQLFAMAGSDIKINDLKSPEPIHHLWV